MSAPRRNRSFAARVVAWHREHGRRNLPWHATRDPYRIWVSEVMLQQTQVIAATPYFERFCQRFPNVEALAAAPLSDVLAQWAGLGYYARARNLHACAVEIVARFGGRFPLDVRSLERLPGIGRSSAAAIAAFCANVRAPILDGNVRRVLARHFLIPGAPGEGAAERTLWAKAETLLPRQAQMPAYTQGLMDLGALICVRRTPKCDVCPLGATCAARRSGMVDQLPTPRRRKALPGRRAWALVALSRKAVLVQKRPASGVWGGLYSLPQFGSLDQLRRAAESLVGQPRLQSLPPRRHAFTHFSLTLMPRLLEGIERRAALNDKNLVWLPLQEIDAAPFPSPIRNLLREVVGTIAGKPDDASRP